MGRTTAVDKSNAVDGDIFGALMDDAAVLAHHSVNSASVLNSMPLFL